MRVCVCVCVYLFFQLPPPLLYILVQSCLLPVVLLHQLTPQLVLVLPQQLLLLSQLQLDGFLLFNLSLVQLHLQGEAREEEDQEKAMVQESTGVKRDDRFGQGWLVHQLRTHRLLLQHVRDGPLIL